jgi:hypothetical protein
LVRIDSLLYQKRRGGRHKHYMFVDKRGDNIQTQDKEVPPNAVEGYHNTEILQMPVHLHTSGHPRVGGPEPLWSTSVDCFVEGPCSAKTTFQMIS